ncbi:hypothetical protein [Chryseobacterium sp.]|uniref:hypothetical protein n=1 Tax=Chryseobacterium sp. TaxID=1871047 RepID=UPI0011CC7111|nr:hypothetical protein [Chryseobacterium sp.]TXF74974.1 hypothetical protein FUA25_11875 [Chryseobacterium sp.]
MEIETEGILSKNFYIPWINTYGHLHTVADIFADKTYRYKNEISGYLWILEPLVQSLKKSDLALEYWKEFIAFPVITREIIQDWLIRCDHHFPYSKYGFDYETDFRQGYFADRGVKINLPEHWYLQNIAVILHNYFVLIPEENSLKQNEELPIDGEDDDIFLF